jgi:hypothetical protein
MQKKRNCERSLGLHVVFTHDQKITVEQRDHEPPGAQSHLRPSRLLISVGLS